LHHVMRVIIGSHGGGEQANGETKSDSVQRVVAGLSA
jgi:hypothetical protein